MRGEEVVMKDAAENAKLEKLKQMAIKLQADAEQEETQPVPAQPGMNKQQSMMSVASKFHTEMTDAELARHQSAEDEAKLKFQEEIRKEQK